MSSYQQRAGTCKTHAELSVAHEPANTGNLCVKSDVSSILFLFCRQFYNRVSYCFFLGLLMCQR